MAAINNPGTTMPAAQAGEPGWKKALTLGVIVLAMAGLGYWVSTKLGKADAGPKRQTVNIAVLPDKPPPPPPPKDEKKPEPPKEEPKQQVQMDQPKVVDAPPQEAKALTQEGPAGDGPSMFAAGTVSKDYQIGGATSGGPQMTTSSDRSKYMFYANNARQILRGELDKLLPTEVLSLGAKLRVWIEPDGTIVRYQVSGVSDKAAEDKLRQAMDVAAKSYRLPAPAGMPQPLELRLSVNPANG